MGKKCNNASLACDVLSDGKSVFIPLDFRRDRGKSVQRQHLGGPREDVENGL
jgi:hypothetical protein